MPSARAPADTDGAWPSPIAASTPATLVCPLDMLPLTEPEPARLCCSSGHFYPVVRGLADLAVVEDQVTGLHHRPDRKLGPSSGWARPQNQQERLAAPRPSIAAIEGRIRGLRELARSVRFYQRNVPLAFARFVAEAPDLPPPVAADRFDEIFGSGNHAHEVLKRLEKELFWDRLFFGRPAYEIGVSDGMASNYFFADREIDYGSEYLIDELLKSRTHHGVRFSANVKFLPYADESLETVLCSQTITCVYASLVSVLAEINRVLRVGGRFVFTTHGPAYLRGLPLEGWPELRLSAADCVRLNEQRSSYMAHLYTLEEWRQILSSTGFDLAESRGILSLDFARYCQLFYFSENHGPQVLRNSYGQGRRGYVVRALFGGDAAYARCKQQYRELMRRIIAHELSRHARSEFDDRSFLDVGIVAVKRSSIASRVSRLAPIVRASGAYR